MAEYETMQFNTLIIFRFNEEIIRVRLVHEIHKLKQEITNKSLLTVIRTPLELPLKWHYIRLSPQQNSKKACTQNKYLCVIC